MDESLAVRRIEDGHLKVSATKNETVMRMNEVLSAFGERDYNGEVLTAVRRFPARAAEFAEWPEWVRGDLRAAYASKGIARPYSHQAAAAEAVPLEECGDCDADGPGRRFVTTCR